MDLDKLLQVFNGDFEDLGSGVDGSADLSVRQSSDEDVPELVVSIAVALRGASVDTAALRGRDCVEARVTIIGVDKGRTVWYQGLKLGSAVVVFTCLEV